VDIRNLLAGSDCPALPDEIRWIHRISYSHSEPSVAKRKTPPISSRKQPKQARSTALVAAILEAAVQVLAKEGAARFTAARVADKAGVSIGSLYQYFPNKAAILFRLQSDEWRQTTDLLRDILADRRKPPFARLRALVHAFIRSECEEAAIRGALDDASPLYRNAPEAREARAAGERVMHDFLEEALPGVSPAKRARAADLMVTTLSLGGKQFSEQPRTPAEIRSWAGAMSDMFCAYLTTLARA
jgi:AcrR family transcriptional regulator